MKHAIRDSMGRFTKGEDPLFKYNGMPSLSEMIKRQGETIELIQYCMEDFKSVKQTNTPPTKLDLIMISLMWFTAGLLCGIIVEMIIRL